MCAFLNIEANDTRRALQLKGRQKTDNTLANKPITDKQQHTPKH